MTRALLFALLALPAAAQDWRPAESPPMIIDYQPSPATYVRCSADDGARAWWGCVERVIIRKDGAPVICRVKHGQIAVPYMRGSHGEQGKRAWHDAVIALCHRVRNEGGR